MSTTNGTPTSSEVVYELTTGGKTYTWNKGDKATVVVGSKTFPRVYGSMMRRAVAYVTATSNAPAKAQPVAKAAVELFGSLPGIPTSEQAEYALAAAIIANGGKVTSILMGDAAQAAKGTPSYKRASL